MGEFNSDDHYIYYCGQESPRRNGHSQQKQDRELTGSDRELLIAKFRLKLKTVEKTTGLFRYDLN